jgi:hypothetical protein
MSAKTAKAERRETKRTLGHKLEEFAQHERTRLVAVEAKTRDLEESMHALNKGAHNCIEIAYRNNRLLEARVESLLRRGFIGRLKWLVCGR